MAATVSENKCVIDRIKQEDVDWIQKSYFWFFQNIFFLFLCFFLLIGCMWSQVSEWAYCFFLILSKPFDIFFCPFTSKQRDQINNKKCQMSFDNSWEPKVSCFHVGLLSFCHTGLFHSVMLVCCHAVMLICGNAGLLSCCHSVILSYVKCLMLLY